MFCTKKRLTEEVESIFGHFQVCFHLALQPTITQRIKQPVKFVCAQNTCFSSSKVIFNMRNTTSSYFPSQIGTLTARIPLGSFKDFSWASNFNGNSRFQFADPLTIQLDGGCFISCRTKSDIESRQFRKM